MLGFRLPVVVVYYFGRPAVTKPTTPRDRQLGSHRILRAISLLDRQISFNDRAHHKDLVVLLLEGVRESQTRTCYDAPQRVRERLSASRSLSRAA